MGPAKVIFAQFHFLRNYFLVGSEQTVSLAPSVPRFFLDPGGVFLDVHGFAPVDRHVKRRKAWQVTVVRPDIEE